MNLHLWVRTITMNNPSGGWSNSVRMHFVWVFVVFVVSWTETVMYVPAENTKSYSGTNSRLLRSTPGQVLTVVNTCLSIFHTDRGELHLILCFPHELGPPQSLTKNHQIVWNVLYFFFRERIQLKKKGVAWRCKPTEEPNYPHCTIRGLYGPYLYWILEVGVLLPRTSAYNLGNLTLQ